jgi:hypothetical protein
VQQQQQQQQQQRRETGEARGGGRFLQTHSGYLPLLLPGVELWPVCV